MAAETLEERVAALEADMAQLKAQRVSPRYGVTGRTNPELIAQMFGMFKDDPHAEEVLSAIEAEREREREEARGESEHDNTEK